MAATDEQRQDLVARESDMWLREAERIERQLSELDPDGEETPEIARDKAWLEHVLTRRDDLAEELLRLQGVLTDDDVVDIGADER